jgi:light-regulated signal transduction histidine kinase (bacteriophytochrome)
MFGADFGFLVIKGEARAIGRLVAYQEAIVLLQYIRQRSSTTIWYSHAIAKDFPDLKWAGNPYEKKVAAGTEYLEPRSSFQRWSETVIGTSREWTEGEGLSDQLR